MLCMESCLPRGRIFLYVSENMRPDFLGDGEAARNFRVRNGSPAKRDLDPVHTYPDQGEMFSSVLKKYTRPQVVYSNRFARPMGIR